MSQLNGGRNVGMLIQEGIRAFKFLLGFKFTKELKPSLWQEERVSLHDSVSCMLLSPKVRLIPLQSESANGSQRIQNPAWSMLESSS